MLRSAHLFQGAQMTVRGRRLSVGAQAWRPGFPGTTCGGDPLALLRSRLSPVDREVPIPGLPFHYSLTD